VQRIIKRFFENNLPTEVLVGTNSSPVKQRSSAVFPTEDSPSMSSFIFLSYFFIAEFQV